jgi:predicted nuclease of predicted toxin-antitoxin system
MFRLLVDENNNSIFCDILCQKRDLDIVCAQDVNLSGADDPTIIEWAAQQGRALLTHDASTLMHHAYETGKLTPGIFVISQRPPIIVLLKDIIMIV